MRPSVCALASFFLMLLTIRQEGLYVNETSLAMMLGRWHPHGRPRLRARPGHPTDPHPHDDLYGLPIARDASRAARYEGLQELDIAGLNAFCSPSTVTPDSTIAFLIFRSDGEEIFDHLSPGPRACQRAAPLQGRQARVGVRVARLPAQRVNNARSWTAPGGVWPCTYATLHRTPSAVRFTNVMPTRRQTMSDLFVPRVGAVFSADIAVPEHEREMRFYSRVLSTGTNPLWRAEDLMNNLGIPIIGLGSRSAEYAHLPLQWMPHIQVADVAASVPRALALGGSVLMHAEADDGTSQWAVLRDPSQLTVA